MDIFKINIDFDLSGLEYKTLFIIGVLMCQGE